MADPRKRGAVTRPEPERSEPASDAARPSSARGFTAVKVFSATRAAERDQLGDRVSAWIASTRCKDVEIVVTQSSDSQFHCLSIVVFYRK